MNHPYKTNVPDLAVAHNLLGKVVAAAQRAGDSGREFVAAGIRRLTGHEIEFRNRAAKRAHVIGDRIGDVHRYLELSLADDGVIDAEEAATAQAMLCVPEADAHQLGKDLAVPEAAVS